MRGATKRLPVYVLAGGRSSRFGSDKARALIDREPLIIRLAQALEPVAERLIVVADRIGKYDDLGLPTIADRVPGQGPLGGLQAALWDRRQRGETGWLLLCACDLLDVHAEWLERLRDEARPGVQAVAFRGECWQPLFALYHTAIAPLVEQQLHAGERSMSMLLERAPTSEAEWPEGGGGLRQANTPAELARFRRSRRDESAGRGSCGPRRSR